MSFPKAILIHALFLFAFVFSCSSLAHAQDEDLTKPKAEIKATTGVSFFGDDADLRHAVIGGSVRVYLTKRISVEPELLYMHYSSSDQDYVFSVNGAVDLRDPRKKLVPYFIAGVGVLHHQGRFTLQGPGGIETLTRFSSNGPSVNVGFGLKAFLTDRLFIAPDLRLGAEPTLRTTISIGYVFSGRKRK